MVLGESKKRNKVLWTRNWQYPGLNFWTEEYLYWSGKNEVRKVEYTKVKNIYLFHQCYQNKKTFLRSKVLRKIYDRCKNESVEEYSPDSKYRKHSHIFLEFLSFLCSCQLTINLSYMKLCCIEVCMSTWL